MTVPPLFINLVVKNTRSLLLSRGFTSGRASGFASIAGLAAIPVIFKPIDYVTDLFIEHVYHGLRPKPKKQTPESTQ